jgi:hypothetical protein
MDISNIDRVRLLYALWEQVTPETNDPHGDMRIKFDWDAAETAVEGYIDSFCGRAIKADLVGPLIDEEPYVKQHGKGAFKRAVFLARQRGKRG